MVIKRIRKYGLRGFSGQVMGIFLDDLETIIATNMGKYLPHGQLTVPIRKGNIKVKTNLRIVTHKKFGILFSYSRLYIYIYIYIQYIYIIYSINFT